MVNSFANGVRRPGKNPLGSREKLPTPPSTEATTINEMKPDEPRPQAIKRLIKIVDTKLDEKEDLFSEATYRDRLLSITDRVYAGQSPPPDPKKTVNEVIRGYVISLLNKDTDAASENGQPSLKNRPAHIIFEEVSLLLKERLVEHIFQNRQKTPARG